MMVAYCAQHSARVLAEVADFGRPRVHFGVGTGELLHAMGVAGADVVGVDWRVPLDVAGARVGPGRALQGNLDPAILAAIEHRNVSSQQNIKTAVRTLQVVSRILIF